LSNSTTFFSSFSSFLSSLLLLELVFSTLAAGVSPISTSFTSSSDFSEAVSCSGCFSPHLGQNISTSIFSEIKGYALIPTNLKLSAFIFQPEKHFCNAHP